MITRTGKATVWMIVGAEGHCVGFGCQLDFGALVCVCRRYWHCTFSAQDFLQMSGMLERLRLAKFASGNSLHHVFRESGRSINACDDSHQAWSRSICRIRWYILVMGCNSSFLSNGSALVGSTLNSRRLSDQTLFGYPSATSMISTDSVQNFGHQREWREGVRPYSLPRNWHGICCLCHLVWKRGHGSL